MGQNHSKSVLHTSWICSGCFSGNSYTPMKGILVSSQLHTKPVVLLWVTVGLKATQFFQEWPCCRCCCCWPNVLQHLLRCVNQSKNPLSGAMAYLLRPNSTLAFIMLENGMEWTACDQLLAKKIQNRSPHLRQIWHLIKHRPSITSKHSLLCACCAPSVNNLHSGRPQNAKVSNPTGKKLYQRRPQIAWKGTNHFRNLINRFKIYKFQL